MQEHRIKKRVTTYRGKAFNVELVELEMPDGRPAKYDLVRHPGAVTIVPLDAEGDVYFVKQYRLGVEGSLLELPAGTLGDGEKPLKCASREIREEIGFRAEKWIELGDFFLAPGYSSEHMTVFLALDLHFDPAKGDEDEFLKVEKISSLTVMDMIQKNQIHDGKTLAALCLAMPYLTGKKPF